jgi:hypothetical protein
MCPLADFLGSEYEANPTCRRMKGEVVAKLKTFAEIAVNFVKLEKTLPDTEYEALYLLRGQLLPALDELLHELHDARDLMLDSTPTQLYLDAEEYPLVPTHNPPVPQSSLFAEMDSNGLMALLVDHVRKVSAHLAHDMANLSASVVCTPTCKPALRLTYTVINNSSQQLGETFGTASNASIPSLQPRAVRVSDGPPAQYTARRQSCRASAHD